MVTTAKQISRDKVGRKVLNDFSDLEQTASWLQDREPCLINILLPEDTLLLPKMNWNHQEMTPLLSDDIMNEAKRILAE